LLVGAAAAGNVAVFCGFVKKTLCCCLAAGTGKAFDTPVAFLYKEPFAAAAENRLNSSVLPLREHTEMDILREFILAIAQVIDLVFTLYFYIVIARALISWVNPDPYNPIVRFLHSVTDPVLYRIRRAIPLNLGGIDFSPIILLIGLSFVQRMLKVLLLRLAYSF
jgi:YggT family protein